MHVCGCHSPVANLRATFDPRKHTNIPVRDTISPDWARRVLPQYTGMGPRQPTSGPPSRRRRRASAGAAPVAKSSIRSLMASPLRRDRGERLHRVDHLRTQFLIEGLPTEELVSIPVLDPFE